MKNISFTGASCLMVSTSPKVPILDREAVATNLLENISLKIKKSHIEKGGDTFKINNPNVEIETFNIVIKKLGLFKKRVINVLTAFVIHDKKKNSTDIFSVSYDKYDKFIHDIHHNMIPVGIPPSILEDEEFASRVLPLEADCYRHVKNPKSYQKMVKNFKDIVQNYQSE